MTMVKARLIVLVWLGLSGVSWGASDDVLQRIDAQCRACHGATMQGSSIAPRLAGQQRAYLARQLQHFKTGVRGANPADPQGAQMAAIAVDLSDEQIVDLAQLLSSMIVAAPLGQQPVPAQRSQGYKYYQGSCGGCHGGRAQGNELLNAPRLAGLSSDYLKRQYQYFSNGVRGAHPDDRFGRQMSMMSRSLPNEQTLMDVIEFIVSQP